MFGYGTFAELTFGQSPEDGAVDGLSADDVSSASSVGTPTLGQITPPVSDAASGLTRLRNSIIAGELRDRQQKGRERLADEKRITEVFNEIFEKEIDEISQFLIEHNRRQSIGALLEAAKVVADVAMQLADEDVVFDHEEV